MVTIPGRRPGAARVGRLARLSPSRARPATVALGTARAAPYIASLTETFTALDPEAAGRAPLGEGARGGYDGAGRLARRLILHIEQAALFPVLPLCLLDDWERMSDGDDPVPIEARAIPVAGGWSYGEWGDEDGHDASLVEDLVAGLVGEWDHGGLVSRFILDRWGATDAATGGAIGRILALESGWWARVAPCRIAPVRATDLPVAWEAPDAAGVTPAQALVSDMTGMLARLPAPLDGIPDLVRFAAATTGNAFLDEPADAWHVGIGDEGWPWSVDAVRALATSWGEAIGLRECVARTSRALLDRAAWPAVLAAVEETLRACAAADPGRC